MGWVSDFVSDPLGSIGDTISGIGDAVGSFIDDPFEFTGNVIEGVFDDPLKAAASVGKSYLLGDLSWLGDLGDFASLADFSDLSDIVDIGSFNEFSDFGDFFSGLEELGAEGYDEFLSSIGDQAGDFPTTFEDLLRENDLMGAIGDQPGDFDLLGSYGDPLAEGVPEAVKNLFKYNSSTGLSDIAKTVAKKVIGSDPEAQKTSAKNKLISGLGGTDALLAAALGGGLGALGAPKDTVPKVGYQGGVPQFTAQRVPGQGVTYTPKTAAQGGLMSLYDKNTPVVMMADGGEVAESHLMHQAPQVSKNIISPASQAPQAGIASTPDLMQILAAAQAESRGKSSGDANGVAYLVSRGYSPSDASSLVYSEKDISKFAKGGISDLGSYTHAKGGRMLKGPGDGMSDSIPADIDGKRPARLATDEFVVSADVVSALGNGSSDAGAKVLYDMMDKVRKASYGRKKQINKINPQKYIPA